MGSRDWLRRWFGPHADVWRARDRLARTLADLAPESQLAFGDVLPEIDAVLATELPRLDTEARFLQRYLARNDRAEARQALRQWERELHRATDPASREVRERNLELARSQAERLERLAAVVDRYRDRVSGLALAIDDAAGRIAATRIEGVPALEPYLVRLRREVGALADELAELGAEL